MDMQPSEMDHMPSGPGIAGFKRIEVVVIFSFIHHEKRRESIRGVLVKDWLAHENQLIAWSWE